MRIYDTLYIYMWMYTRGGGVALLTSRRCINRGWGSSLAQVKESPMASDFPTGLAVRSSSRELARAWRTTSAPAPFRSPPFPPAKLSERERERLFSLPLSFFPLVVSRHRSILLMLQQVLLHAGATRSDYIAAPFVSSFLHSGETGTFINIYTHIAMLEH